MAVIKVAKSERYIPAWDGNKDVDSKDQIAVEIKFPNTSEVNELKAIKYGSARDGADQFSIWFDRRRILQNHALSVENLKIEVDGREESIATGKQLAEAPKELTGLVDELVSYIMSETRGIEDSPKN